MINGSSTVRLEFINLIESGDADRILLEVSEALIEATVPMEPKDVQKMVFPTSSEQPEEYPFVVVQYSNLSQISVTRRGVTFVYNNKGLDPSDFSDVPKMLSALFESTRPSFIQKNNIRMLEVEFNAFLEEANYKSVLKRLGKYFKTGDLNLSPGGFSFSFNTEPEYSWATNRRVGYGSGINVIDQRIALQVSEALTLGGFSFKDKSQILITSAQVEAYIEELNEAVVTKTLGKYYEKNQ